MATRKGPQDNHRIAGASVAQGDSWDHGRDRSGDCLRGGEAEVLNETGTLHQVRGNPARAEGYHQQALELARAIASPWDEACALAGLGRCAIAAGHATQAQALLRQAQQIFQRIGAAETRDILAELDALTRPGPAR